MKSISNFKKKKKKYLIVEQKHIILIVEDFEKKMARELTIDLNMIKKIRGVMLNYSHNQAFLLEEFDILIKVLYGHVEHNGEIN